MRQSPALALILLAVPAVAQIDSLSTTFNGARAYFATSLQQTGKNQPPHGKAFWAHTSGAYPQLIRRPDTSFPDIRKIQVSGDASIVAVTAQSCPTQPCRDNLVQSTVFPRRSQPLRYDGSLLLSPNGEWALRVLQPVSASVRISVVHLESRRETTLYDGLGPYCTDCHSIADDGTAAITLRGLELFGPGGLHVELQGTVFRTAISANGQVVAWESADGIFALRAPFTGEPVRLSGRFGRLVMLDRGGFWALFLWAPDGERRQAYLAQTGGRVLRQVTFEPTGIRSAALSGNGRVAWAFTNDRKLWKIQLQPRLDELITTMPPVIAPTTLAIGSASRISAPVVPSESIGLRINGVAPPYVAVESGALVFQVPWELEPGSAEIEVLAESGFDWTAAPTPARVQPMMPGLAVNGTDPIIAHEDWSSLVTQSNPARRGEVVHVYATGLGPVVPAPRTGEPADAGSLVYPIACEYNVRRRPEPPLPLLYAGPAPQTVGYYQLSFKAPLDVEAYENNIRCRQGDQFLWINLPVEP